MGLRKGIFKSLTKSLENVTEMGKEAVIDKDKFFQLKSDLLVLRANLMMKGKGSSITKVTICAIVAWLVGVGSYGFLVNPELMLRFKDLVLSLTPLIGILIGSFGAGKMFKNSKFSKDLE